jgi:GntR family transcriptional repressor for pyruvate dehydrogenase complex
MALTDEAIEKIKDMIVRGDLRPGDRLPPEKELSERLGLSRSSMREAVKALEVIRVLDVRRGDGTYVTSLDAALLLEAVSFIVDLHHGESILEIFAVRRVLEAHAATSAAMRATPDQVAALKAEVAGVEPGTDIESLAEHDTRFHALVADISDNRYLSSLLENMSTSTLRARVWRGLTQDSAAERTLREHDGIADAIAARDPDLAAALMTAHIAGVEDWLRRAADETLTAPATRLSETA